jgi:RNA polymerase sigma factor (sigma-70 family)
VNDAEAIRRSLEEPSAFEVIFDRHFQVLQSYARRRVGPSVGEDIAAQTFVVAFQGRARFDPAYPSARPWLFGIATNIIRHHLRDERTHLAALSRIRIDVSEDPVGDPERLDARRLRPEIVDALLSLSVPDRETFLLVALGELNYEETANALGIPIGTVRSRINRARMRLRERLGNEAAIRNALTESGDVGDGDG